MRFTETLLPGVWVVDLELLTDDRGHFARTFDREAFAVRGLDPTVVQCNTSFNAKKGTLRGLHYQREPHAESKLVRCVRGAIFDVAVDLRPGPTHGRSFATELHSDGPMLYLPAGLAHGFQTLVDDTEVHYQMGHEYVPSHAEGIRWDDPSFDIRWPDPEPTISDRDRSFPDYK